MPHRASRTDDYGKPHKKIGLPTTMVRIGHPTTTPPLHHARSCTPREARRAAVEAPRSERGAREARSGANDGAQASQKNWLTDDYAVYLGMTAGCPETVLTLKINSV